MAAPSPAGGSAVPAESRATTVVSTLLAIHLFCILVALSSNLSPSLLQARILEVLRPYVQLLNLNPDFTPYHLTHGTITDVDHRWEILPAGHGGAADDWIGLTTHGFRGADRYKRLQRLAKLGAIYAQQEEERAIAEIAQTIGSYAVARRGITPAQIRCRRHLLQPWEAAAGRGTAAQRDPNHETYFQTPYVANVLVDASQRVSVAKISERRETALPSTSPANPSSGGNP